MAGMKTEFQIRLIDNFTPALQAIQNLINNFNVSPLEKMTKVFSNASFTSSLKSIGNSFKDLTVTSANLTRNLYGMSTAMRGLHQWSEKTVSVQTELQKTMGLIATKVTDSSLKAFGERMKLDLDINQPKEKLELLNKFLNQTKADAQKWALGVGDFAKIAPMSEQEYLASIKQLLSSGLSESEATLSAKYSSVMSKALEATHADAAYDMARIYNNIKAVTPNSGLINTEEEMRRISSLFDYMDNNFQFKIGKNAITQLKKTLSVGLTRGFNFEELGIAAGFMSSTGLEGGMGDTALKEFISRLSIAETKAKAFGLAFEYTGKESLPEIITNLKTATAGLDKKGRADFFREAFGERGVQAAERLIEKSDEIADHVGKAREATKGLGSSYNSAYLRSQDFDTALAGVNNQLAVYTGAVGVYTTGIRWMFTDMFRYSVAYLAETENQVLSFAAKVGASFAVFGGVVTAFAGDLFTLAAGPIEFLGNFGLAMNGIEKTLPLLQTFATKVLDLSKKMITLSISVLKNVFSLKFWTKTLWQGIWGAIKMVARLAVMAVGYTLLAIAQGIAAIATGAYTLMSWLAVPPSLIVGGTILLIVLAIGTLIASVYLLWNYWDKVWGFLKDSLGGIVGFIANIWIQIFSFIWGIVDSIGESVLGSVWQKIKDFFKWVIDKVKEIGELINYYFGGSKTTANVIGDVVAEGSKNFDIGSSLPEVGSGKSSKAETLPAGYAYQIDRRFDSSRMGDAVKASDSARVAIPETQLDVLRKIYDLLVEWRSGSPIVTSGGAVSEGGTSITVENFYQNVENIDEIIDLVDFNRKFQAVTKKL